MKPAQRAIGILAFCVASATPATMIGVAQQTTNKPSFKVDGLLPSHEAPPPENWKVQISSTSGPVALQTNLHTGEAPSRRGSTNEDMRLPPPTPPCQGSFTAEDFLPPDKTRPSQPEPAHITALRAKAEKGDAHAQFELGKLYLDGKDVPKDDREGARWLAKAAENGELRGAGMLAINHFLGVHGPKDSQAGLRWLNYAAERGDSLSQRTLAHIFATGSLFVSTVAEKDLPRAAAWYRRAAVQGHTSAQISLGTIYAQGDGVMQDFVEAYKWLNIAAASPEPSVRKSMEAGGLGVELSATTAEGEKEKQRMERLLSETPGVHAKRLRDLMASQMTTEQIAEAQRRSRAFVPRKEIPGGAGSPSVSPGDALDLLRATGTGFFISADGYLITSQHVVEDARTLTIRTAKGDLPARLIRSDTATDLAVLKVEGRFTALPVKPSRTVRLGDTVATVGFPNPGLQGFAPKLTKGDISSLSGLRDDPKHFQVSLPVQPGNSGGALVDTAGNVVGVVAAKISQRAALATTGTLAENVNYAVKSSFLLSLLESVPDLADRLKPPRAEKRPFADVVREAEQATVLILVY